MLVSMPPNEGGYACNPYPAAFSRPGNPPAPLLVNEAPAPGSRRGDHDGRVSAETRLEELGELGAQARWPDSARSSSPMRSPAATTGAA
jgi:hypothetical protein